MRLFRFRRKRIGLPALALFLAANALPRPAIYFHTHAGGEAAHVHEDGEDLHHHEAADHDHGHHHHDDFEVPDRHESAFDEADEGHRGHWHSQHPYPLAASVTAIAVVFATTVLPIVVASVDRPPATLVVAHFARGPPHATPL